MPKDTDFLFSVLKPQRLTSVVDIGANPIDGDPPYKAMLEKKLCSVVGFEPQSEALQELQQQKSALETYLPHAIGDGNPHTLYQCRASGMTSLFEPDKQTLSLFNDFSLFGEVLATQILETRCLDDVDEIETMDYLKIDIQGTELEVFQSGHQKLQQCVAVQTEVSFIPLYKDQPVFWQIDKEMRALGFIPHAFDAVKRWPLVPYSDPVHQRKPLNQLLEADIVYVRDFIRPQDMSDEQIKQLALIAQHVYASYDLVMRCLSILVDRDSLDAAVLDEYVRLQYGTQAAGKTNAVTNQVNYSYNFKF
jgi:FkbM family methyltransferase